MNENTLPFVAANSLKGAYFYTGFSVDVEKVNSLYFTPKSPRGDLLKSNKL